PASLLTPAAMADDVAPRTASAYLDPSYWDERFGKEEHYEWFKDFSHFRHLLAPLLSPSISVLEVGCGNSRLGEELLREGVAGGITCVDLSPVAVQRMRDRLAEQGTEGVEVVVADMLDLPFDRESFDLVIEKGTMDVLFVDSGDPWNPNPTTVDNVMKMLEGIHKVLKPEGIFVSITFGQPHFRRRFFEAPGFTWSVEWSTFGDGFHYFFYILKKGKRLLDSNGNQHTQPAAPSINMFHEELESEDYIFRTNVDEL
ncbi:Os11g0557700, partial [Oryza sativa Japonica Group]